MTKRILQSTLLLALVLIGIGMAFAIFGMYILALVVSSILICMGIPFAYIVLKSMKSNRRKPQ